MCAYQLSGNLRWDIVKNVENVFSLERMELYFS